jgi:hypothetical protein
VEHARTSTPGSAPLAWLRWLVAGALAALATAAAAAEPVGLVTELNGAARIARAAGTDAGRTSGQATLALLDEIPGGATLSVERGATVVVSYTLLGSAFELKGPGRFRAERDGVRALDGGRVAARSYGAALQVARFAPGAAVQASIVTRGGDPGRLAMAPKGPQLEASARTIRWRALGDEWRYRVLLIDADGDIVFAADTTQAEATVPSHVELKRGRTYIWTVTGSGPRSARDEASGKFELVDADTDRRYSAALAALPQDASAQVVLALSLEQTGLRQEAAHLWRSLAAASPQHPVLMERAIAMQRALAQPR